MAPNILELIRPQDATDYVRELFNAEIAQLPLQDVFPFAVVQSIYARFRTSTRTVTPVKYRVFDAETPYTKRTGAITTTQLQLPPLGAKLRLGEQQQHDLIDIALNGGGGGAPSGLIDQLFDDLDTITRGIVATLVNSRGDLFVDGVMALGIEDGQTMAVDFGTPSSHRVVASPLWSDLTNGKPLTDELNWLQLVQTDQYGAGRPLKSKTSLRMLNYMQQSLEYKQGYANGASNLPGTLSPTDVNTVRGNWNLPPLDISGVDQLVAGNRVLPDNRFWFVFPDMGQTQMGPTLEARNLAGASGNLRLEGVPVPGLVGVIQSDGDPAAITTKVAAVGMPVLLDKNKFFTAQVA